MVSSASALSSRRLWLDSGQVPVLPETPHPPRPRNQVILGQKETELREYRSEASDDRYDNSASWVFCDFRISCMWVIWGTEFPQPLYLLTLQVRYTTFGWSQHPQIHSLHNKQNNQSASVVGQILTTFKGQILTTFKTCLNPAYFCGNHRSPLSGSSAQPFLEPLVLLFWILGTFGFPWIAAFQLPLDSHPSILEWSDGGTGWAVPLIIVLSVWCDNQTGLVPGRTCVHVCRNRQFSWLFLNKTDLPNYGNNYLRYWTANAPEQ